MSNTSGETGASTVLPMDDSDFAHYSPAAFRKAAILGLVLMLLIVTAILVPAGIVAWLLVTSGSLPVQLLGLAIWVAACVAVLRSGNWAAPLVVKIVVPRGRHGSQPRGEQ